MNRGIKICVILVAAFAGIIFCYGIAQLLNNSIFLLSIYYDCKDNYDIEPYEKNLSGKDSVFIKTSNYFLTLVPSGFKDTHDFSYKRNSGRKRTFHLRANSSGLEDIFLKNISYNSKEAEEFLQYVGIKKEQLDTLDSYLDLINCNSIRHFGIFSGLIDRPKVELKMNPKDIHSYTFYDSISFTNRYRYDSITHHSIIDSVIVKKGPHMKIVF